MRDNRKLYNLAFVLSLTILIIEYGHLIARSQTGDQKGLKNPTGTTSSGIRLRLSQNSGPQNGGNRITITGGGFNDETTVMFGGVAAEVIKPVKAGTLTVVVPGQSKLGSVTVTVSTPNKKTLSARYLYRLQPPSNAPTNTRLRIIRIEPSSLPANKDNSFIIYGQGFSAQTKVEIDNQKFTSEFVDGGKLKVFIPADSFGPGAVDIQLIDGVSGGLSFTANAFTFTGPKIFWVEPSRGTTKGGVQVRIEGRYLKYNNPADVLFGDVAIQVGKLQEPNNDHIIYVDTPPHQPGWVDLVIHNAQGQTTTLTRAFYYEEGTGSPPENIRFSLKQIFVQENRNPTETSWRFDIRANNKRLCELASQTYSSQGKVFDEVYSGGEKVCQRDVLINDPDVRLRVLGIRGDVWMEGEVTVSVADILKGDSLNQRIVVEVRANTERKGYFVFLFNARQIK